MKLCDIKPFIRFARYEDFSPNFSYQEVFGLDCRLYYVMSGTGIVLAEGQEFVLSHGDLLLINSAVAYEYHASCESVQYITLNFDFTFKHSSLTMPLSPAHSGEALDKYLIEHVEFEDFPSFNNYVLLCGAFFAEAPLVRLEYEYRLKKPFHEYYTSSILSELLILMARHIHTDSALPKKNHEILDEIIKFINDNYDKPLTNASLGKHFGFHPNHLSAMIKCYVGAPLHKYLVNIRMEKAMALLQTSGQSIEAVAAAVGMPNAAYFSRYFKSFSGFSPFEYRQTISNV